MSIATFATAQQIKKNDYTENPFDNVITIGGDDYYIPAVVVKDSSPHKILCVGDFYQTLMTKMSNYSGKKDDAYYGEYYIFPVSGVGQPLGLLFRYDKDNNLSYLAYHPAICPKARDDIYKFRRCGRVLPIEVRQIVA